MSAATPDQPVSRPRETQIDRTRLAWRRTTLTATVVVALGVRDLVGRELNPAQAVALLAAVAGWLGLVLLAERRIADLVNRGRTSAGRWPVMTVGMILLMCAGGLWLSVTVG